MIIAIDYDGTVADTNTEKVRWIKSNLHRDIAPWNCDRTDCVPLIGESEYRRMGEHVYGRESTLTAGPIPGAIESVSKLAEEHTLYLLSARGEKRLPFAVEWLVDKGIDPCFAGYKTSSGSSKAAVCHTLGASVLIDDDPRHLMDPELGEIHRILLQNGRAEVPAWGDGIRFCDSWKSVMKAIR